MTTIEVTNMRVKDLVIKTCEKHLFEPNDEITRDKIKNDVLSEVRRVLDNIEFEINDETINIKHDKDYGYNESNESNV
jgi:hypothetical protein